MRRDLAEAQAEIAEAMKEIDAHAADIRRAGQDPEQLKATSAFRLGGREYRRGSDHAPRACLSQSRDDGKTLRTRPHRLASRRPRRNSIASTN